MLAGFASEWVAGFRRNPQASLLVLGRIVRDTTGFRTVFDPTHPAADPIGNLKLPNVNSVVETACGFRGKPATHSDAKPASVPI